MGLEWILPYLYHLLSLKVPLDFLKVLDEREKKRRTHEALRSLYLTGSQIRPLVVTIENINWMDNASAEYLNYRAMHLTEVVLYLVVHFSERPPAMLLIKTGGTSRDCLTRR